MNHSFIKLITVVLCTAATVSAQAEVVTSSAILGTPVALNLSAAGSVTPTGGFALGDLGSNALGGEGGFATTPGRMWEAAPINGIQVSAVPLPEPSSETALYFLSGAVGLALVVMRRRTLA